MTAKVIIFMAAVAQIVKSHRWVAMLKEMGEKDAKKQK